ncbi:hypothetical protein RJT34_18608 [Clitoria ternatea]|uniref:Uncharacterized protein n=1 Tax=Clitoria ternatea TaxID=43366 RepID=A0AAN9PG11_CLITE
MFSYILYNRDIGFLKMEYLNAEEQSERSLNRLRSFNSYPDLRQLVPTDEHFHFHNDTSLFPREQKPRLDFEEDHDIGIENVAVAPSQSPPPTPPEHQSEVVRGNV